MIKALAAALAVLAIHSSPAMAQEEARPFSGFSVTGVLGVDHNRNFVKATGALYGVQIGYDLPLGSAIVGVEGEISGSTAKKCGTDISSTPVSNNTSCFRAGPDAYIGARAGVVVGNSTLLYAKGGYTSFRMGESFSYSATPNANFATKAYRGGYRVGAGLEQAIAPNLSVRLEYRFSRYNHIYDRHQAVVGASLRY